MFKRLKRGRKSDSILLYDVFLLIALGFIALASASFDLGKIHYNNAYYFLEHQMLFGFIPGLIAFLVGYYLVPYRRWKKVSFILFLMNLILLVLVFTPIGRVVNGSHRWISISGISFQPSEFLKFTMVLYLASLFSSKNFRKIKDKGWKVYLIFIGIIGITSVLILKQPATTIAVILAFASLIMYFISGVKFKFVLITIAIIISTATALVIVTPYRMERVIPIWNDMAVNVSSSLVIKNTKNRKIDTFHSDQSIMSIGSGGLFGVGFGKSTSKYDILPEPMSDSIFTVIAEETGFVGSSVIIILYVVFLLDSMRLVRRTNDYFAKLLVVGFSSIIVIQAIVHISANAGILPFTGVTLPFISYGGTSMAVLMGMVGVMAHISKNTH